MRDIKYTISRVVIERINTVQPMMKLGIWCSGWAIVTSPPPLVLQRLGADLMPHQVHLQKKSYEVLIFKFLFLQKLLFNSARIQVLNEGGFFYVFFCSEQFLQTVAEITQNRSVPWMEKQLLPGWKRNFPEMWKITERSLKGALLCTCKQ